MGEEIRKSRKEALEHDLGELHSALQVIEGDIFRKYITEPVDAEFAKLKAAFDCENMYELKYTHGKRDGLKYIQDLKAQISNKIAFINEELSRM